MCRQPLPPPLSPPSAMLMIMALEEYEYQSRRGIRFCRHLCQHHVPSAATVVIVFAVCQANDHGFGGLGGFSALAASSLFDGEAWMPCVKGLSPVCLLAFRIIPSCLLLAASIANVATHGRSGFGVGEGRYEKKILDHLKQDLMDVVFDGAFGGVGVVVGEGVVVISSSLDMLTNSCLGGIMVSLIYLEGLDEEALVEFMVDWCEEDEDDDRSTFFN
ncbi:hypothetical protein Tco_0480581 [Tanacetum coccineum]